MTSHPPDPTPPAKPWLTWAIIGAGIAFTLWLVASIPDEVFYAGDGGLRALLARQIASGRLVFYLDPPVASWVRELWDRGLYPFGPPFVYEQRGHHHIVYPFIFPLVSGPFYALMGFRGLYVVPLVALWALWVLFARICHRAGLNGTVTTLSLTALVFGSPLTLYGAMYWDHTLAVFLAFASLSLLIPPNRSPSKRMVVMGGLLLAASGLVRGELFCLVGLVTVLLIASPWLALARGCGIDRHRWTALASILAGMALIVVANQLVYGRPLGMHSVLAFEDFPADSRMAFAWTVFWKMTPDFFGYFPLALFACALLLRAPFRERGFVQASTWLWVVLSCGFLVAVVALLPSPGGKQWSPRFLLVLVPLTGLVAAATLGAVLRSPLRVLRVTGLLMFVGLVVAGVWRNTVEGTADLRRHYARRAVPLVRLRQDDATAIAVSHQFVSQQLEALLPEKALFLARSGRDLRQLAATLAAEGQTRFVFVCYPVYPCGPVTASTETISLPSDAPVLRLTKAETLDRYLLYEAEVLLPVGPKSDRPASGGTHFGPSQ